MVAQSGRMPSRMIISQSFEEKGNITSLDVYEYTIAHFAFAAKHDICQMLRHVAGGHLTDSNTEGNYLIVVSIRHTQCFRSCSASI
jgi:hypothetical protein